MSFMRVFLAGAIFALLAACETEPLVDSTVSSGIVPRNIVVDTSEIAGIEGRDLVVAPSQLSAAILIARGASVAFLQSNVQAILQVKDVASGADIIPPTAITGNSEQLRLGGAIGVITAPNADVDYQQTIRGFAAAVRMRIFGGEAST